MDRYICSNPACDWICPQRNFRGKMLDRPSHIYENRCTFPPRSLASIKTVILEACLELPWLVENAMPANSMKAAQALLKLCFWCGYPLGVCIYHGLSLGPSDEGPGFGWLIIADGGWWDKSKARAISNWEKLPINAVFSAWKSTLRDSKSSLS